MNAHARRALEPDATITVKQSSEGHYFGHVDSDGTTYNAGGSAYFVVDVTIPANFKFEGGWPSAIIIYGQLADWVTLANAEAASGAALVVGIVGSLLTRPPDEAVVSRLFDAAEAPAAN